MTGLMRRAMAILPLSEANVEKTYAMADRVPMLPSTLVEQLCASHERLRREAGGAQMVAASRQMELEDAADAMRELADAMSQMRNEVAASLQILDDMAEGAWCCTGLEECRERLRALLPSKESTNAD